MASLSPPPSAIIFPDAALAALLSEYYHHAAVTDTGSFKMKKIAVVVFLFAVAVTGTFAQTFFILHFSLL
jgi:hypothetical protein